MKKIRLAGLYFGISGLVVASTITPILVSTSKNSAQNSAINLSSNSYLDKTSSQPIDASVKKWDIDNRLGGLQRYAHSGLLSTLRDKYLTPGKIYFAGY